MSKKKLVTIGALIAPLLSIYTTNFFSFTFFDIYLILLSVLILFRAHNMIINRPLLKYGIMIVSFHIIIALLGDIDVLGDTLRMLRYLFYILFLSFFSTSYFDSSYGEKVYRKISTISSLFLLLQFIVYKAFGRYIPGFLTFLTLDREELLWHATNYQNRFDLDPRPRSFFSEPQIFASFVLGYLAIVLFKKEWTKRDKFVVGLISVAIVVSRSNTAVIGLVFLWGMWFYNMIKRRKINPIIPILMVVAFIGVVLVFPEMHSSRLSFTSSSFSERMNGYVKIFEYSDGVINILFGQGMIRIPNEDFLPSLLMFFRYFGVVGSIIVAYVFMKFTKQVRKEYKYLLYLVLVLLVGTVDFFGIMIFTSIPFIISSKNRCDFILGEKV